MRSQKRGTGLAASEQETIIVFNRAEEKATIFTYNRRWQRHLEGKMGLKPVDTNGHGARWYELPKSRIRMPQPKKQLSAVAKAEMVARMKRVRSGRRQEQPSALPDSDTTQKSAKGPEGR